MTVEADLDVLIPTYRRPDALAVTLAGLANQTVQGFRVVVADQTEGRPVTEAVPVATMLRRLALAGSVIDARVHRERAGMAEQRQFLLDSARAGHVLYLDDDVFLDAATLARMLAAIRELGCGFVGCAPRGLSYLADQRPAQLAPFEPVDGPPGPERVRKGQPAWDRWMLHNAANAEHLAARVDLPERGWLAYRVAWVAGCVLYDRAALVAAGGFGFWRRLPASHRGEEIVAQLRVMERVGGVGLLPSGAVHLELPTAVTRRSVDAYATVIEADDREGDDREADDRESARTRRRTA